MGAQSVVALDEYFARIGYAGDRKPNLENLQRPQARHTQSIPYRFGLQEQLQADYEVASWYLSNHPQSHFVTGLIASRPAPVDGSRVPRSQPDAGRSGGPGGDRVSAPLRSVRRHLGEQRRLQPRGERRIRARLHRIPCSFSRCHPQASGSCRAWLSR